MRPPAVHTGPTTPFGGVGCTWVVVRAVRTVEVCQQQVSSRVQCLGPRAAARGAPVNFSRLSAFCFLSGVWRVHTRVTSQSVR